MKPYYMASNDRFRQFTTLGSSASKLMSEEFLLDLIINARTDSQNLISQDATRTWNCATCATRTAFGTEVPRPRCRQRNRLRGLTANTCGQIVRRSDRNAGSEVWSGRPNLRSRVSISESKGGLSSSLSAPVFGKWPR